MQRPRVGPCREPRTVCDADGRGDESLDVLEGQEVFPFNCVKTALVDVADTLVVAFGLSYTSQLSQTPAGNVTCVTPVVTDHNAPA